MNLQHQDDGQQGEFFLLDTHGSKIACLSYFYETPQRINANHTFVDTSLRGQGIADKLYQALMTFIEQQGLELHPTCSYIEKKWQRR